MIKITPFREALKDAYMCSLAKRVDFENRLAAIIASHPAVEHAEELLEALEIAKKVFDNCRESTNDNCDLAINNKDFQKICSAIASAKGEQNG